MKLKLFKNYGRYKKNLDFRFSNHFFYFSKLKKLWSKKSCKVWSKANGIRFHTILAAEEREM